MNILVTGAKGFVGRNLCAALNEIKTGHDQRSDHVLCSDPAQLEIFEYDIDSTSAQLDDWCAQCDFVFNLAGVNRPKDNSEFMAGNFGFASQLLDNLKKHGNACPVMLSSSIQASLEGRYAGSEYGKSKRAGEELFFEYGQQTGAQVLVYRFPNLFGKWCRPNYNSAVATFCHNTANGLPVQVNDPAVELDLAYIDDVVEEMLRALRGEPTKTADGYCTVPVHHQTTLGFVADTILSFPELRGTLGVPSLDEPLVKKLYSTYLSYLPKEKFVYDLKMNCDQRGSFTEIIRTADRGQFSVNVSKPGITKGNHWHHTKNEKFVVVSGKGVIRFRKIGDDKVHEYFVSGDKIEVVDIPVGYTHNIENLGDTDMVTFMWANECFDPEKPDTFFEEV